MTHSSLGAVAYPNDAAATTRTGRDHSPHGGLGHRHQDRRAFHEAPLHRARLSLREPGLHPTEHGCRDARDVLVGGGGRRVEHRRSADGKCVNPVQEQGVEMRVSSERRIEALDHGHRAGLERAHNTEPPRPWRSHDETARMSRPALPVPVVELEIGWHVPGIEVSVVRHQRGPDIERGSGGEKVDAAL